MAQTNSAVLGMQQNCGPKLLCYRTQPGDTLASIAQMFDTTSQSLIALNPCVKFNRLCPGTKIRVRAFPLAPNCPVSRQYIVGHAETLTSIAQRFNTTPTALLLANPNFPPSFFRQGNIICLPVT